MIKETLELFIVRVHVIELQLRRNALREFKYNPGLCIEADITDKTIEGLEELMEEMEEAQKQADNDAWPEGEGPLDD